VAHTHLFQWRLRMLISQLLTCTLMGAYRAIQGSDNQHRVHSMQVDFHVQHVQNLAEGVPGWHHTKQHPR
jgi:hypothetical protein